MGFQRTQFLYLLPFFFILLVPASSTPNTFSGTGVFDGRRVLADAASSPEGVIPVNSSLVLASYRTYRKDPLENFNYYSGGWNISSKHYWASVGFTAAPLFGMAAAWFALFGIILIIATCCYCCCPSRSYSYSKVAYACSLLLLIIFTIAAVFGCVVLYYGQGKFYGSMTNTLNYVVSQANVTSTNLKDFSSYLASAKSISVDAIFLPISEQAKIDSLQIQLNSTAYDLQYKSQKNKEKIQTVFDVIRWDLVVIAAVMLALIVVGFLFSLVGWQGCVYFWVFVGWLLVTGTFILAGVFLVLHNAVGDTCVAMDDWVLHPSAKTALDDILPCTDVATANASLYQSKSVTREIVNVVDQVILNISNVNFPSNAGPLYYNQSGPLMPALCNPFNDDLTPRTCQAGEVDFNNATQVWQGYQCAVSSTGICTTTGRVTPAIYNQMTAAVNVSYGLYRYTPFLVGLEDCSFVRETFTSISSNECPGLRKYSEWVYFGLSMVSAAVLLSLIFWIIYGRERRHRKESRQYAGAHVGLPSYNK